MTPYNEQEVIAFQADVEEAYTKAGQSVDLANVIWAARMQYDAVTMGYPTSRAKHLTELYVQLGLTPPFEPAPRVWRTNMCGMRVAGLSAIPGGAADPTLFVSWLYHRYPDGQRAAIRKAAVLHRWSHVLLSWPDARAAGITPVQFRDQCEEWIAAGIVPSVMLYSKDVDPADVPTIEASISAVLPLLLGMVPVFCVGWELSIELSPTQVQQLIDWLAPQIVPTGAFLYVHFQQGYFAFQQPGGTTADFWKLQVGNPPKLRGVLHQRMQSGSDAWDKPMYQARITDCLERFAGQDNFPPNSGDGTPFDFVALEITAMDQFNGAMSEADGNTWGDTALATPPVGTVHVMGSGNGQS